MNYDIMKKRYWMMAVGCWLLGVGTYAQTVADEVLADIRRAAGMHYALPLTETPHDTPPPEGKRPFYINHYGCPSSYYLERPEYYDDPYLTLSRADSLGKLTPLGRQTLQKVALLRKEAKGRTGELTAAGKRQTREMARQLAQRLPEVFVDSTYIDGRSIVQNHCLLTLGEAVLELSRCHQPMRVHISASHRSQPWMSAQDKELEALRDDSLTMSIYNAFAARWAPNDWQLMTKLFNDAGYAKTIDATALSRQLFDLAGSTQYTETAEDLSLFELFTTDDLHRHWMRRNAWAYIRYGGCSLTSGRLPYIQRRPLWNLIHQGDSMMKLERPVVHLRYTNETTVMSLACLLELLPESADAVSDVHGFGVQTACLDSLEALGWADYRIAPLGGSVMLVHYRSSLSDRDPLVRVLLNGRDARLPITTNCYPYYHWKDVKRYYLRKLYAYARERNEE